MWDGHGGGAGADGGFYEAVMGRVLRGRVWGGFFVCITVLFDQTIPMSGYRSS